MKRTLLIVFGILAGSLWAQEGATPSPSLSPYPQRPDYAEISAWAAHPAIEWGSGKRSRATERLDRRLEKKYGTIPMAVPTFFIYPTLYFEGSSWNADCFDATYRREINDWPLANQASVFNGVGLVYAPHYRQMMYRGYYPESAQEYQDALVAYDTAFADVKRAFEAFIALNPEGRYILAGHSQGTGHAKRLMMEVILPNKDLRQRLLVAYLVGNTVTAEDMGDFPLCADPTQTDCWMGWRSYGKDFYPKKFGPEYPVVNPITWSDSPARSRRYLHKGALYSNGKVLLRHGVSARIDQGTLRIERLRGPLGWFFRWEDYHRADYNMFWFNIRENLYQRVQSAELSTEWTSEPYIGSELD